MIALRVARAQYEVWDLPQKPLCLHYSNPLTAAFNYSTEAGSWGAKRGSERGRQPGGLPKRKIKKIRCLTRHFYECWIKMLYNIYMNGNVWIFDAEPIVKNPQNETEKPTSAEENMDTKYEAELKCGWHAALWYLSLLIWASFNSSTKCICKF